MHDKTQIIPIIDDLTRLIQEKADVEIVIGNFTNLDESMITRFLNDYDAKIFNLATLDKIKFSVVFGTIQCFDCDFTGEPINIIQDHALHTNTIVACPSCDSIQTKKIGGNNITVQTS